MAVPNTSESFDVADWGASGGFQAYAAPRATAQVHPFPCEPPDRTGEWRIAAPAGSIVAFSAAHLHGTVPQETGRIRYTVEIRLVDRRDVRDGRGAPDADNASRGATLGDFRAMMPVA